MAKVKAQGAADLIAANLAALPHPDAGIVRLTMFSHDSPGLKTLRTQIGESLVMLLEGKGWHICEGLDGAASLLTENGYTVYAGEKAE